MRAWRPWIVVMAMAFGACTAIDDFSRYHSSTMVVPAAIWLVCPTSAVPAPPPATARAAALVCMQGFGGKTAPGGICTRPCSSQLNCADLPNATLREHRDTSVCMPKCDAATALPQRLRCCANRDTTNGPGACAPTNTDFCGQG